MAGTFRFVAKSCVVLSVLAAGAAGAFYGATTGWPAIRQYMASNDGVTSADRAQAQTLAPADLDAVASAWAEPAPVIAEHADSTPHPRSAEVVVTKPAIVPASYDDRYGAPPAAGAEEEQAPAISTPEPEPTLAAEVQPLPTAVQSEDLAKTAGEESPTETDATPPLARGQEPTEAIEPQPIVVAAQAQSIDSSRTSGRDTTENPSFVPTGDRYGSNRSRGGDTSATKHEAAAVVNPFSAAPASSAPAPSAAAEVESIQPLPGLPEDAKGGLAELQTTDSERSAGAMQPLKGEATARSPSRPSPSASRGAGQPRALDERSFDPQPLTPSTAKPSAEDGFALPDASSERLSGEVGTGRPGEKALEGPQRPALEIQKFAPPEIQVGKPAKFAIQVRNVGTQPADGVTVRDEIPHGTRLISTSPTATNEGQQIVWQLGKLSPGEDRTLEIQVMPTAEGELGSVATVSHTAQASVKTRCTMPQLAIRMTAPNKVLVGQEQRVKIELRNPGSGDATGVMLFENVPPTVRHAAGATLEFEVGTLRAGETRELELVLLAEKPGKTVNVLTARADGNLQVQQQVEFEVIAPALAVEVSGPERRYLERPATYEVIVENPGTAPAHDVQIITKLPKGMQFVRANNLGEYDSASHAVYWSLAELPEGERGTVEVVAMPTEAGQQTLQVESRASAGLSDQAQQQIIVDGLAAIMFELRDLEDPIEVGGETGYEIRIVNQGTKSASNVQMALSLPPGMQLVSAEGETQHTAERGIVLFEPIPQLGAKAETVYRVRVQGTQAGDQRVTVEVNTDDLAQPIRREESTRVFGDE